MKISVIISTYNSPAWLEKVLWGYTRQTHTDFEIIIADDGSDETTAKLIKKFETESGLEIHHVWHEDKGYRRQTILNKAILQSSTEYILFTDGDCIPRQDFISVHVRMAEKGKFLSGGYCKISNPLSLAIEPEAILNQSCFSVFWLLRRGMIGFSQMRKLWVKGVWAEWLDAVTTAKPTFNNCNSSAWKSDLLKVNGYDERMQYGGADREIGERLVNAGVLGKQIRHRAICIHLFHKRGYATADSIQKNQLIRAHTRKEKITWSDYGIQSKHNVDVIGLSQ